MGLLERPGRELGVFEGQPVPQELHALNAYTQAGFYDMMNHVLNKRADKAYMASVTDEYLVLVIKKGGAAMGKMATMPAWGKRLSDEEIRSIVAHIREF